MARLKKIEADSQIFYARIDSLEDIVSALKTSEGNLQRDIKGLDNEVGELNNVVGWLPDAVKGLRDEVKGLRDVVSRKRTDAAEDVREIEEEAPSVTMRSCKHLSSLRIFLETYLRSHIPDAPNRNRCLENYGFVGRYPN
jgi:predicted  nucleic acid-binding Zn-ribbon protein